MKTLNLLILLGVLTSCATSKIYVLSGNNTEAIRYALLDNIEGFRECVHYQTRTDHNWKGTVLKLNFSILPSGQLTKVHVENDTPHMEIMNECVVDTAKSIRFGKVPNGQIIDISQPLNFYPKS